MKFNKFLNLTTIFTFAGILIQYILAKLPKIELNFLKLLKYQIHI
jgi:hypothetical protein